MLTVTNKTAEEAGIYLGELIRHTLLSRETQLVRRLFGKYGMIAKENKSREGYHHSSLWSDHPTTPDDLRFFICNQLSLP